MITENIKDSVKRQNRFFGTHQTKSIDFRIEQLKKLQRAVKLYEERICEALYLDLHKSKFEAIATEVGMVTGEIAFHLKNLRRWSRPRTVPTNQMIHLWSTSCIYQEPYGRVLIIAPWNYPFQLMINPLIGAISAGNCVTLKASEFSLHTAEVMREMISSCFDPEYISFFTGDHTIGQALLAEQWDYIFFTGSPAVGKIVMQSAARHMTPVALELGGKSPCIVDDDADLAMAATRIAWGKFLNAGQTCIAPDYLLVHSSVKERFIQLLKQRIVRLYGPDPKESSDFCRIITVPKTRRLAAFLNDGEIVAGGQFDIEARYVAPTILDKVSPLAPVMQEEIFGPVLPVLGFSRTEEVIEFVNARPKPLAFYYFSSSEKKQEQMLRSTSSGGGCINEVIMHIANDQLPFGGVGNSGIGNYHGEYSFKTFSHARSILNKSTLFDVPLRYAPYGVKDKLLKYLFR